MAVSAEQYALHLANLLPHGAALAAEPGSEMAELLSRLGRFLAATHNRGEQLLDEASPWHTLELLPEWDTSLGLPDSCSVSTPTLAERRASLVAKLTDAGGARIARFVQLATALGYPGATTQRFSAHTCEFSCETPLNSEDWRFSWQLRLPTAVSTKDSTCESGVEDPIQAWGNTQLSCVIAQECPQPSTVLISYGA